jgi:hypothetical protein
MINFDASPKTRYQAVEEITKSSRLVWFEERCGVNVAWECH